MWFVFALITTLSWGAADLFYKKGADEDDRYSHLKTAMMVGLVMGLHAIFTLIFGDINYDPINLLVYFPVSLMYISSMVIGYFGLKYLELSIASPIQNASGAVAAILCLVFLRQIPDTLSIFGIILICGGVFALGILEKKKDDEYLKEHDKKYKIGFVAFLMPLLYCVIDALGTFLDAFYLDDAASTPLKNVTEETLEDVANVSYELTFLICAVGIFIFMLIKKQKFFTRYQGSRLGAATLETAGQFTYVKAMSGHGSVAAPMIGSYCIVSILLSRIFLKEKLSVWQYVTVAVVVGGIVLLGVAEGISSSAEEAETLLAGIRTLCLSKA